MTLQVGDIVESLIEVVSGDDYGTWLCAKAGDRLVVFSHIRGGMYEVYQAWKTPDTHDKFWIRESEVELVRAVNEDTTNLAYSIKVDYWAAGGKDKAWDQVAKILREFKKRKHAGFYFDVQECRHGYVVKVYKDK